jgi:hypothetical protein
VQIERHRAWIRFALIYLTVTIGFVAAWILIAPRGFYDTFPGGGTHWVSALPAFWMERRVVQVAAISLFVAGLPHLAYHATTTGRYSTGDNVASLTGLALDVLVPLAILYLVSDHAQRDAAEAS